MILSTQSFSSDRPIKGCGVDIEYINRFEKWVETTPPFIYSEEEITQVKEIALFQDKLKFLCSAFCVKEALFKALSKPYNFNECTISQGLFNTFRNLKLSDELIGDFKISNVSYFLTEHSKLLIIGEVYLF